MTENDRELGRFEALLDELAKDVSKANERLDDLAKSVDGVRVTLAEFRGGWKTLTVLSGLVGAFLGAIVAFMTNLGSTLIGRGR